MFIVGDIVKCAKFEYIVVDINDDPIDWVGTATEDDVEYGLVRNTRWDREWFQHMQDEDELLPARYWCRASALKYVNTI